jgi:hypothetical protein
MGGHLVVSVAQINGRVANGVSQKRHASTLQLTSRMEPNRSFIVQAVWSVFYEHRALVLAHMPWKQRPATRPHVVVNSVLRDGLAC